MPSTDPAGVTSKQRFEEGVKLTFIAYGTVVTDTVTGMPADAEYYDFSNGPYDSSPPPASTDGGLKVDGADVLASRVTSVDSDANLVGLFPYIGPFDVAYRVTLPRAPSGEAAGKPFVLEIARATQNP